MSTLFFLHLEVMLNSVKNPKALKFFCPMEGIGGGAHSEHICILIVLCYCQRGQFYIEENILAEFDLNSFYRFSLIWF